MAGGSNLKVSSTSPAPIAPSHTRRYRRASRGADAAPRPRFESLEPRRLLTAPPLDGNWAGWIVDWESEGGSPDVSASIETFTASIVAGEASLTIDYFEGGQIYSENDFASVERTDDGWFMMQFSDPADITLYASGGADTGSNVTWFREQGSSGNLQEPTDFDGMVFQIRAGAINNSSALIGSWELAGWSVTEDLYGASTSPFTASITLNQDGTVTATNQFTPDGPEEDDAGTWQFTGEGTFTVTMNGAGVLNGVIGDDGNIAIITDIDGSDGEMFAATLTRVSAQAPDPTGFYRINRHMLTDAGEPYNTDQSILLELAADGTYAAYDLDGYDFGGFSNATLLQTGMWDVSANGWLTTSDQSNDFFLIDGLLDASASLLISADLTVTSDSAVGLSFGVYVGDELTGGGSGTVDGAIYPQVAVADDGHFVMTWTHVDHNTNTAEVFAQLFDADGSIAADPWRVNSLTDGDQAEVAVAMSGDGTFLIVWSSFEEGLSGELTSEVWGQYYDEFGTAIGENFIISEGVFIGDNDIPTVAMDDMGRAVVVWSTVIDDGLGNEDIDIYAQQLNADGTLRGDLIDVTTTTTGVQDDASVAMDADGNFVIVWTDYGLTPSDPAIIYGRRFDANGNPIDNVQFAVNTAQTEGDYADVAMGDDGSFAVTWSSPEADDDALGIFMQRFAANGTKVGDAVTVNTDGFGVQDESAIAISAEGRIIVTWTSKFDGSFGGDVVFQMFNPNGSLLGEEGFVVDPMMPESPYLWSDVAFNGDGDAVIVWTSIDEFVMEGVPSFALVPGDGSGGGGGGGDPYNNWTELDYDLHESLEGTMAPAVSTLQDGSFVMVYLQDDFTNDHSTAYIRRLTDSGTPIGDPIRVSALDSTTQSGVDVAGFNNGFAVAWMTESANGGTSIWVRAFNADGTAISSDMLVAQSQTGQGFEAPKIAARGNGEFAITWQVEEQDGTEVIKAAQFNTNGTMAGSIVTVNGASAMNPDSPDIGYDADGTIVITWAQVGDDGTGNYIWYRTFQGLNAPTRAATLVSAASTEAADPRPQVTMNGLGRFTISWSHWEADGSEFGIYFRQFDINGNATGDPVLANMTRLGSQRDSAVAMNYDGQFVVGWTDYITSDFHPYAIGDVAFQRFDADGTANGWEEVMDDPGTGFGNAGYATITLTNDGDALIAWTSIDTDTWSATLEWDVFAWDDSGGGGWQNPFDELDGEAIPDVAVNASGLIVSTWTQRDQSTDEADVFFQLFDENGEALADAVRANTTTEGMQGYSRIALNDNGEFVITWAEVSDVDESVHIYARKFSVNGGPLTNEILVSSELTGMNYASEVAIANDGSFVITWSNFDPTDPEEENIAVYARRFSASGTALDAGFVVNAITDGIQEDSDIAMDANGNFTIVWSELYFDGWNEAQVVAGRQFNAAGQALTTGNFIVSTAETGGDLPEIAMADNGSFVVTWASELADGGEDFGVFGQWFSASAVRVGNVFVANETAEGDQDNPVVAMNGDGEFVVGWTHFFDDDPSWGGEGDELFEGGDIYYRLYAPFGLSVGSEVLVPFDQGVEHGNILTSVAMADNGNVVLVWMNADATTSTSMISMQVIVADQPAPPITIEAGEAKQANEGASTRFAGVVNNGDGHTLKYLWDFGDGFTADTLVADHTYADNGIYTATLQVWDEDNNLYEDTVTVTVANVAPIVSGPSDKDALEGGTLVFRVSATDPGKDTLTYRWNMGDGTIYENRVEVAHTYADDGQYTVTVTVSDEDGGQTVDTATANISNVAPIVDLGMDKVAYVNQNVGFSPFVSDPGTLDVLTYEWNFGDNSATSTEAAPTHAYALEGLYTVTLTVRDGDGGVTVRTIDVEIVSEQVTIPTAPAAPVLLRDFDLGLLDTDGVTSLDGSTGSALQFEVTNVTKGATVELYAGNTLIASGVATGAKIVLTVEQSTGLEDGYYAISARQVLNGIGGQASDASIVWIDTEAPDQPQSPVLIEDIDGDGVTPSKVLTFTGAAEVYSVVELYRNGTLVGTAEVGLSGLWSIADAKAPLGNLIYSVVVVDLAGNRSQPSDGLAITHLDAQPAPPTAPVLLDFDGEPDINGLISTNRPVVTGTATAGMLIRFYIDDVLVGLAETEDDGSFTVASGSTITDGVHTLYLTAAYADEASDVESKPSPKVKFTIDTSVDALATPYLNAKSDTGDVNNDGITNDGRPLILGEGAEKGALIIIRDQNGNILGQTIASGAGKWSFQPDSELEDGAYLISATQIDSAGNESDASDWLELTIDRTAPTAAPAPDLDDASDTGVDDEDNVTASETLTFTGYAEANAIVNLLANGRLIKGAQATADSQGYWEITVLKAPKGESTWTVQQTDLAGNISELGDGIVVNVVLTAPAAPANLALSTDTDTGASDSDGITSITRVTVTGTGIAGNTITLFDSDGVTELGTATVDENGLWEITTSPLSPGEHSLQATQTDLVGNTSKPSRALRVEVDTSASAPTNFVIRPGKTYDTGSSDTDGITSNTLPQFQGDGAERGATINMYDQFDNLVGTTVAKSNGAWTIIPTQELTDGEWQFTVRQVDIAGNTSLDSDVFEVTIDRTAPDAGEAPDLAAGSDTGVSSTDNVTGATQLVFTGTAEAFAEVRLTRDGKAWGKTPVVADADGNFTITVEKAPTGASNWGIEQTDAAGNVTLVSETLRVEVITKAPKPPVGVTLDPASDTGASDRDLVTSETELVLNGTADAGNTVTLYDSDQTTVLGTAVADGNGQWTITTTELSDGLHEIYVAQTDLVGNTSSLKRAIRLTVDTEASVPTGLAFKTVKYDTGRMNTDGITSQNLPLIVGVGAERGGTVNLFDQDDNLVATAVVKSNGSWAAVPLTPLTDGEWELVAVHTDLAGNVSEASDPFVITIDRTAPVAGAPDLDAGSDDGESNSDNLTSQRNLSFTGAADAGAEIVLFRDGKRMAEGIFADDEGNWLATVLNVALGEALWTVQVIDLAGNVSTLSEGLLVNVIAPA